jgi:predicted permease
MIDLRLDIRDAWRACRRAPGFVAVAILTLALGVAATTTVFTIVYGALLKPIAGMRADGVFSLNQDNARRLGAPLLESEFRALAAESSAVVDLGAVSPLASPTVARVPGRADQVLIQGFSGNVARLFDLHTQAGRWINEDDDRAQGSEPVAVISDWLWREWFHGAPTAIGASMRLGPTTFRVAGIASREFVGLGGGGFPTDVWVSLARLPSAFDERARWFVAPDRFHVSGIARLRPGVSSPAAAAALTSQQSTLTRGKVTIVTLRPVETQPYSGAARGVVDLATALSLIVLAGACANVANLLLSRYATRAAEVAVRLALGATRARLVRLALVEAVMMAGAAGLVGTVLAVGAVRAFASALADATNVIGFRLAFDFRVDGWGWLVGIGAGLASGLVVAALVAWQSTRPSALRAIVGSGGSATALTPAGRRTRLVLVAVQVTAAVVLIMSTGLVLERSRETTDRQLHLRYDVDRLTAGQFQLASDGYTDAQGRILYDRVLAAARRLPDVEHAAIVNALPGATSPRSDEPPTVLLTEDSQRALIRSRPRHANAGLIAGTPGVFDTLGLRVTRGRSVQASDVDGAPLVAVLSESVAAALWPDVDPIGRSLQIGSSREPWVTIVGLVDDPVSGARGSRVKETSEDTAQLRPSNMIFVPLAQRYSARTLVLLRSDRPVAQVDALRALVRDVDPNASLFGAATAAQRLDAFGAYRAVSTLATSLGASALAIAMLGIYGVVSYFVSTRTREIGIRIALGATRLRVVRMVLDYAIHIMLVGLLPGVFVASVGSRVIESRVWRLMPNEISTWVIVPLLVLASGVLAGLVPASRAARVDPNVALKDL